MSTPKQITYRGQKYVLAAGGKNVMAKLGFKKQGKKGNSSNPLLYVKNTPSSNACSVSFFNGTEIASGWTNSVSEEEFLGKKGTLIHVGGEDQGTIDATVVQLKKVYPQSEIDTDL